MLHWHKYQEHQFAVFDYIVSDHDGGPFQVKGQIHVPGEICIKCHKIKSEDAKRIQCAKDVASQVLWVK